MDIGKIILIGIIVLVVLSFLANPSFTLALHLLIVSAWNNIVRDVLTPAIAILTQLAMAAAIIYVIYLVARRYFRNRPPRVSNRYRNPRDR